jgi:S-adenosylmethionine-diacylglycerol 3-amino-3-carboxypropyl transferase
MTETLPKWVTEAAALPLAFAQVREDPRIDRYVVARAGPGARVCMVASGGCTAAVLATVPNVESIHLIDANPAQLALTRLKLQLLETTDEIGRLGLLGHADMRFDARQERLTTRLAALGLTADALGPIGTLARDGPDYTGRYERCFRALAAELATTHLDELLSVLKLTDPCEQARRVHPETPLGRKMDEAVDSVMSLPNLVALFGAGATRNPVEPFSRHFAGRIRHALATHSAAPNPFLWRMLQGQPGGGPSADWFTLPAPPRVPAITWQRALMVDALRDHPAAFDVVHLSNILDWLAPPEATATLELAARALHPNGQVVIRQLNSALDIPALGPMFEWERATAADLHARDRSFFYRALHLGRKR